MEEDQVTTILSDNSLSIPCERFEKVSFNITAMSGLVWGTLSLIFCNVLAPFFCFKKMFSSLDAHIKAPTLNLSTGKLASVFLQTLAQSLLYVWHILLPARNKMRAGTRLPQLKMWFKSAWITCGGWNMNISCVILSLWRWRIWYCWPVDDRFQNQPSIV